jgi:RNA polymerase sigma-70 factor (ECF subfamily)
LSIKTDSVDNVFNTLFRRYEQPICSYLARLTGDAARAQELTQETFIRAYRALGRGENWDNPRAWLYRVASRLATDDYRRRKLWQWLPLSGTEVDSARSVEAMVTEWVAVQAALNALPPKYRIPLTLYVYEECSVAEVAEMLKISESAVKMRLSRAREKFRRAYEQDSTSIGADVSPPVPNRVKMDANPSRFWPPHIKEDVDGSV